MSWLAMCQAMSIGMAKTTPMLPGLLAECGRRRG
jgi:hypothetical protein